MSQWDDLRIQAIVEEILLPTSREHSDHHFGSPYLTAYQIAIEFALNYSVQLLQLDLPVGGRDSGQHYSLAEYLARQLSGRIKSGEIRTIEGRLVSNLHVKDMIFDNDGADLHSSISGNHGSLSMFRLIA